MSINAPDVYVAPPTTPPRSDVYVDLAVIKPGQLLDILKELDTDDRIRVKSFEEHIWESVVKSSRKSTMNYGDAYVVARVTVRDENASSAVNRLTELGYKVSEGALDSGEDGVCHSPE